jgi:signal transduction histidine kinase
VVKIEVAHGGITAVDLLSKTREARSSGKRGDVEEECTRLGLGMYVAQQIVMAHGGQMHTDSNDGAGTRFTIELPRDMEPAP